MFIGIGIVFLLAIVIFLVLLPLVKNDQNTIDLLKSVEKPNTLDTNKEAVLTTINEIEFEYKMKKLSDDDYKKLTNEYKQKALEILRDEDDLELETETTDKMAIAMRKELESEIDRDIKVFRKQRKQ